MFVFGQAGIGKTVASIQFPNAYIIDTEKGTDFYATLTLRDEYDQFVNLNSYSVVAKYSNSYISSTKYNFTVNIVNAATGTIEIKLNQV